MIRKILGPPGTGKTKTLLDHVDSYIKQGVAPHRIGYFAFTKKAAGEAKERMIARNPNIRKKDLRYFQTLHSLAFHTLGMSEDSVLQPIHYEEIGRDLSIRVNCFRDGEEHCYLDCDNEYFKLINKARVKNISVEEEFNTNEWTRDIDLHTLNHVYNYFNKYKSAHRLHDYTDMIVNFTKEAEKCPNFDVIFIDEAQDLAPIQWNMFDILKNKSDNIYLAGDDDQAIFAWAGADVDRFIDQEAEETVLNQSERIPGGVQEISQIIIERIQGKRKEKKYFPKRNKDTNEIIEGIVDPIFSIDHLNLYEGEWLVLTRTTHRAMELSKQLKQSNLYFKNKYGKSYDSKLYKSVLNWTELSKGNPIPLAEAKDIMEYLNITLDLPELNNYSKITIDDLNIKKGTPWYDAFTNADQNECLYIRNMLAHGEKLSLEPRVEVSTIHAAKGGECTNVILALDNTKKIRDTISMSVAKQDEEHRVWYVGVTRSGENLYLLKSKKERNGYNL